MNPNEDPIVKYANSQQVASNYSPTSINSQSLQQQPTINYQTPQYSQPFPVAALGAPTPEQAAGLGVEGEKAQNINQRLQEINNSLVGESAYRSEQENAAGVQGLNNTVKDLTSRLNTIKNEGLALSTYAPERDPLLAGRGITTGGLLPYNREHGERIRLNAVQALSVNSLLEASRGNLTTALDMVDRAVKQKFDPIREELAAKTANLDLILKSPAYDAETKQRAQAQKDIQDAKLRQLNMQEQNMRDIQDLALQAAKNGADPLMLQAIQSARTPQEAMQIAAEYGVINAPAKPNLQVVKLDNGSTIVVDMNTGETVRSIGGAKPGEAAATLSATQARNHEAYTLAKELLRDDAVGKGSAVGASFAKVIPFGQALGWQPDRSAFEAKVNTLKANLTLDNLKLLKGAMSDKDLLFLNSVGSSLDTNMSEAEFNKELKRIIGKFEAAGIAPKEGVAGNIIIAPDGTEVEIID